MRRQPVFRLAKLDIPAADRVFDGVDSGIVLCGWTNDQIGAEFRQGRHRDNVRRAASTGKSTKIPGLKIDALSRKLCLCLSHVVYDNQVHKEREEQDRDRNS